MDAELGIIPVAGLVAWWLTERMADFVPVGRWRALLAFVPIILGVAVAVLLQLAVTQTLSAAEFGRAFLAALVAFFVHGVKNGAAKAEVTE